MADADVLLKLADRCEAASGPDHEIDLAINLAVFQRYIGVRKWTASLDSAMELKPDSWRFAGLFERNCELPNWKRKAELWHPESDKNVRGIARNSDIAALALCTAALRARAAQAQS